jgi:hypothetical protein
LTVDIVGFIVIAMAIKAFLSKGEEEGLYRQIE